MKNLFSVVFILVLYTTNAQLDPNGVLILNSGTTAEINAISPQEGALVYNTDTQKTYIYDGTTWVITTGANENWTINGNHQYSNVSGNVGIGIINPEQKLDVKGIAQLGNASATNGVVHMVGKYNGINHTNIYGSEYSSGATVIGYAIQPKFGSSGYASSAQNVPFSRGLLKIDGRLQFLTASSALVNVGSDVALTPRFTIANNGNVGIGSSNPSTKLEVSGQVKITGGNPGTGKVLTSDASGLASWQSQSVTDNDWTISGNNLFSAVSGNVGIGTSSPNSRLDVREESTTAGITTQEAIHISSTVASGATNNFGIYANSAPTSTGTITNNYSIFGDAKIPVGSTTSSTFGVYGRSLVSGTTTHAYGVYGIASIINGGSAINSIRGGQFYARARSGSTTANAYGTLSYAQHEGTVTRTNVASYSVARPLSGGTVKSNFSAYNFASIPTGGLVTSNNIGTYSITEVFGSVSGSNFGTYSISRLRGGSIGQTNYGVYSHTGHINGTLNGINYGVYSYSPGDATSSVGTNYAGYFNADHRGNVNSHNYGIYSIARTANGGTISGSNYAAYFHAAPVNTNGSGFGTISGNNFGVRIVMGSSGVSGSTYGIYQSGDSGTKNYFQNTVGINTTGGAGILNVNGVATKTGGGVWAVFSDKRSKENIKNYKKGLNELIQLRPVSFNYKESFGFGSDTHVGFIAQEIEKIVPSMVTEADMHGIKDFKQVDANEVTFMLINAVKELKTENQSLKKRLDRLEKALINSQKK